MDGDGIRSRPNSAPRRLAKYGATFEPPKDDAVHYPDDDTHSFFAKGRDFESAYVNHHYTAKERQTLGTYESADYLPSHSEVYKHWLKRQPRRLEWDRWLMMGFIGFAVGFIGFLLHQIIDILSDVRWERAREYIADGDFVLAWVWVMGFSLLFLLLSASSVVFLRPSAGGSGIPELIGFLNGTVVRHIFNIKTMMIKFFSCCFAVGSGMPVGPEGPMIHLGSLVGAGLSQFKSDTLKIKLPFFERFRNSEDRRNFISAGAAAGVASAFGAPVGGLLFSMEEVSSFWNEKLSWQIFFCCMVSTFTTDLFNSAFSAFRYDGDFGLFKTDRYILFQVKNGLAVNILAFIPTVIIGVIGGTLGALFTFVNLKIARTRKRLLSNISVSWKQKLIRLVEPVIIIICFVTLSVFLPLAFECTPVKCAHPSDTNSSICLVKDADTSPFLIENDVENYTCPEWSIGSDENTTWTNRSFNQVATLLFVNGEHAIHHLFSRGTHLQFGYGSLVTVLVIYFFFACWSAGTSISSGLVVPMLYIGGCYGRIIGRAMVDMFGVHLGSEDEYWAWMDPGAFALIGAASFFGGVSRLTMSLTVIMMEITNDIQFLLPIMVGVMVSKWMGDFVTHPLYHALLELKCIPHLSAEPVVVHEGDKTVNLELYSAKHIMSSPAVCVHHMEPVQRLAHLLMDTPHGGFPVFEKTNEGDEVFGGFITRLEITVLLMNDDMFTFTPTPPVEELEVTHVEYQQLTLDKLSDPQHTQIMLQHYCDDPKYETLYVNLRPYVNQSAVSLHENFSLHRTYIIFRTLGLRHLTVVNHHNHIKGVISRKDLMGFNLEEKLLTIEHQRQAHEDGNVELSEGMLRMDI